MTVLILLGAFIGAIAILLLVRPEIGFEFGRKHFVTTAFHYGVGVFSLLLAAAIYTAAPVSKFPALFEIVALFSLVGAIIVFVLPQNSFRKIVSWELETFLPYGRVLGLCYALIGGFVVYAAL